MEWRIYYDDETTFDNIQGEVWDAPGLGVVCVVCILEGDRAILSRWDYYVYKNGEWCGHDLFGLLDQLTSDRDNTARGVKAGRTIATALYKRIMYKAKNDEDFRKGSFRDKMPRTSNNL